MKLSARLKPLLLNLALVAGATLVTLGILDLALIATGLFPPTYNYGDPKVGWLPGTPDGTIKTTNCRELATDALLPIVRNEDAIRTSRSSAELRGPGPLLEIVVSGDSHTDLCAENERTHFGYTESELNAAGIPAAAYAYGSGKYSPLQAYLAIEGAMADYAPDVFVLNLYTGNDFYDMLRVDDRPSLEPVGDGTYRLAPPVWYTHDPPDLKRRSRVLFAARRLAEITGISRVMLRVHYLRDVASAQHQGLGVVTRYMNDLRKSADDQIGYPQAYTAQMLNQQLFFAHFPGSREESVRRVDALLKLIREKHPNTMLMLSPIPSYQLVVPTPTDSGMLRVLGRLPITYAGGVAEEEALYTGLREQAAKAGWMFVDNLTPMRGDHAPDSLFNKFDYHLEPRASQLIGRAQAAALRDTLAILRRPGRR